MSMELKLGRWQNTRPYLREAALIAEACAAVEPAYEPGRVREFKRFGKQACILLFWSGEWMLYYNGCVVVHSFFPPNEDGSISAMRRWEFNSAGWLCEWYREQMIKSGARAVQKYSRVTLRYIDEAFIWRRNMRARFELNDHVDFSIKSTASNIITVWYKMHGRKGALMWRDGLVIDASADERSEGIDPVVYRRWKKGGDIIALFLAQPTNPYNSSCVNSYLHIGQHSEAHYQSVIAQTTCALSEGGKWNRPAYWTEINRLVASVPDVARLHKELEYERGYNPWPVRRDTSRFEDIRLKYIDRGKIYAT